MTYDYYGERVLEMIEHLDPRMRDQILDDLEVLCHDPYGRESSVLMVEPYHDTTPLGNLHTALLADGDAILLYQILRDYPRIWLINLLLL